MKKVLMLLQSTFPPDIRVEREITSLSSSGYKVALLCNQYEKSKELDFPGCEIYRLKAHFNNLRVNKVLNFPLFLNPRFIYKVLLVVRKYKPDIIHSHDLPMVPLGLLVGKLLSIPVIFDVHESYPEALIFFDKKGLFNYLFKNPKLAKILERYCFKAVDRLIVVVKEHKEKLISEGIPEEKIVIVSNTVDLISFSPDPPNNSIIDKYPNRFIVMYTGIVSHERGLEVAIKSLPIIKNKLQNILLLLVGEGPAVSDLEELTRSINVEKHVEFIKWPGHHLINNYMGAANVCIIPQPGNDFINSGVPNKLFEYMHQRKTILVSDARPMSRIVREVNAGKVFISNDEVDFAEKIVELSKSDEPFGSNGRRAVEDKYNWNNDSKVLLELYSKLLPGQ